MQWTRREKSSVFTLKSGIFEAKTAFVGSKRAEK